MKNPLKNTEPIRKKYKPLRVVKVYYNSGDVITTNMSANLTNKEIRDYYRVGKVFNLGKGARDSLTKVKKIEILK